VGTADGNGTPNSADRRDVSAQEAIAASIQQCLGFDRYSRSRGPRLKKARDAERSRFERPIHRDVSSHADPPKPARRDEQGPRSRRHQASSGRNDQGFGRCCRGPGPIRLGIGDLRLCATG